MDAISSLVPGSLEEASLRFREFLRSQGWPDQVQWLSTGRVILSSKGQCWINARSVDDGATLALKTYQEGVMRGLGISIEAFCKSDTVTFAYVVVPADQIAAEQMLIGGLKLSVPVNPQQARVVESSFLWWVLGRLNTMPIDKFCTPLAIFLTVLLHP